MRCCQINPCAQTTGIVHYLYFYDYFPIPNFFWNFLGSLHLSPPKPSSRFYEKDEITKAEIRWCLQTVSSHFSQSAAGACSELFKIMFPDSEIAQGITLGRSKVAYIITYGLGPFFRRELLDDYDASLPFSAAFDESLNKISQSSQMDVCIRYWSKSEDLAVTKYLGSAFLGHTTAEDLLKGFKNEIKAPLETKQIVHYSMVGPNVNAKFRKLIEDEIKKAGDDHPECLYFRTCGLHTLHNSFKCGLT